MTSQSDSATDYGILVGVDGSPESDAAVRWAAREAGLRHRPVTLMHVVTPIVVTWPIDTVLANYYEWQEDNAGRVLTQSQDTLARAGAETAPTVHVELRHDSVVPEFTDASAHAELLVLGSRGLGPVSGALLGSVSRALLHRAQCPVVIVKDVAAESDTNSRPVLLGIDGSPASENATAFALDAASRRGADLVALHAWSDVAVFPILGMDWHRYEEQGHEVLAERLAGWQERYPDVHVRRRIVCDTPARWLIDESRHSQLVVVGSHGRSALAGSLLGSVSTAVAESAFAPVAVVGS